MVQTTIFQAQHQKPKFGTLFLAPVLRYPKRYVLPPVGQKLREEIDLPETGHFWPKVEPWRPAELRPMQKNYLYGIGLILNISARSFYSIKSLTTF